MENNSKTIYRYKLSSEIEILITNFSKLHIYTSRQIFREKWKEWLEINREAIELEKNRLMDLGYKKNVEDKMYTAGRYYFKKKEIKNETCEKEINEKEINEKETRGYIILDEKIIKMMDNYIIENYTREFKPSSSYNNFIELNKEIIDIEIQRLIDIDIKKLNTRDKCRDKIKKTYKNRCFVLEQNKNKTKTKQNII
jgi:hypothetical protein